MSEFGPVNKFDSSPEHQVKRVENLATVHALLHMDHQTPASADKLSEFIKGHTGEDAVDRHGYCNLCDKAVAAKTMPSG